MGRAEGDAGESVARDEADIRLGEEVREFAGAGLDDAPGRDRANAVPARMRL
jgi:hypothetical protein